MSNTYTQLYVQIVFAVKGRENLLQKPWRSEIFKYMAGTITAKNQKPIIVNGVSDHVHLFVCMTPSITISDLVRDVKNNSSKFINNKRFVKGRFSWQNGFGAFTYSHSQLDNVYKYVLNQEAHHKKRGFKEEYLDLLNKFDVNYDSQYLFDWPA